MLLTKQQFKLTTKTGFGLFTHLCDLVAHFFKFFVGSSAGRQFADSAAILDQMVPLALTKELKSGGRRIWGKRGVEVQ